METLYVIDLNAKFDGTIITTVSNGIVAYSGGQTFEEYKQSEGQNLNLVALTWDVFVADYLKPYHESLLFQWVEITEDKYDDMLNCLPPVNWSQGSFFISEAYTNNIHSFYAKLNGKFYGCLARMVKDKTAIMQNLVSALESNNVITL